MYVEKIQFGSYYHIYNRGINSCELFTHEFNYDYFLQLYNKHVSPVVDTYAWVLMQNHFHFLIRIKDEDELEPIAGIRAKGIKYVTNQISKLFNAYAQAFNKQENRHGSLFEKPFERKLISDEDYLKSLILYIHTNPLHHKVTKEISEYKWSSYHSFVGNKDGLILKEEVVSWFGNIDDFIKQHSKKIQTIEDSELDY